MERTEVLSNLIILLLSLYASRIGKGVKRKKESKKLEQPLQTAKRRERTC